MGIARSFSHHIHRCTLALGNLPHVVEVFFVDQQSHALLRLVGDDLLGTECLVANRQLGHVYLATAVFHEFRQTVQMSC